MFFPKHKFLLVVEVLALGLVHGQAENGYCYLGRIFDPLLGCRKSCDGFLISPTGRCDAGLRCCFLSDPPETTKEQPPISPPPKITKMEFPVTQTMDDVKIEKIEPPQTFEDVEIPQDWRLWSGLWR
ncbi:hypothetical protein HA402_005131 [Bradysia odoriphaga]|nr:hypothetical protein HA402_005131 [Bradysia odoriphaga]